MKSIIRIFALLLASLLFFTACSGGQGCHGKPSSEELSTDEGETVTENDVTTVDQSCSTIGHSLGAWYITAQSTCTTTGVEKRDCANCDYFEERIIAVINHDYGDWYIITEPTCTETGTERHNCANCENYEEQDVAAIGHSYTSITTAPTCTERGFTTYTCGCGESYVDTYVDALGHSYGEWFVTTEPTCTQTGTERHDCANCDYYEEQGIIAKGHSYTSIITPPTCAERGYTTHTCHCGNSYIDSYVNATGHSYGDWYVIAEPTCTETGKERHDCANCNHYEEQGIAETGHNHSVVVTDPICTEKGYTTHTCYCGDTYTDSYVDANGHSYGDWHTTKESTCEEPGVERHDCTNCDSFEERGIPAIGHIYTPVITVPTCVAQGYTTYTCSCGCTYVDTYVAALGHSYGNWYSTLDATCVENGKQRRDCANCEHFEEQEIAAKGHAYTLVVTAPTCTERGYTTHICHCGDAYIDSYVNAIGHTYGDWYITTEPTCTEIGIERHDCANCDHYEEQDIAATGHSYTSVITPPTCTERGYTTHTCICGDTYIDSYVAAGHSYAIVVIAPTCTERGYTIHTCHCGDTYVDSFVDSLGHTEVADVVTAPTCTEEGYTTHTCEICGDVYVDSYVNPLEHQYTGADEWSENEIQYVGVCCAVCGDRLDTVFNGIYLDESKEMYLWNCPTTFSFDVRCAEGVEYVRENVWVMKSLFSSLDPVQYGEICENIVVESLGYDTYRISHNTNYTEAEQYSVILGDKVEFCHLLGSKATFRIEGEGEQVVEYNQNVLFLKDLEETLPGYYPYELTYDEETELHTLILSSKGALSEAFVGKVLCIGDCRNFDEIKTADGEIVFGKIKSITETENGVVLILSNPTLSEVYDRINVSAGTMDSITVAATSEEFQEQLLYQVANSEGFAEAMTAARLYASDYATARGMKAKDSPFDMDNFKITSEGTSSDKDSKTPWAKVNFKITYEYEIPIEKGEYKGSVTFNIEFDVQITYLIQAADTNLQVQEGKHWWNGTYLHINIELVQEFEAELDIQVKLDLHETDSQMDYIISSKIHRYSCITCEQLRQDRNNLVTLDYVKSIPNYEDYECKICKPFTMTDSQFILNLNSNILHCGNCVDAQRITKAPVVVYELYPLGGTFKNCERCKPQENSGLDNYIKNSLGSSDWSVALDKVKEGIQNELKAKDAGETKVDKSKPVAAVNVFYVFNLNFYLQPKFDFDLEASLHFNYKLKTRDVFIICSQIDENGNYVIDSNFDDGAKTEVEKNDWTFDLQGKATARIGVMAEATFGFVGIKDAYIGLYAETGLYAHLNGVLHLDNKGENYYGANLEAGVYFDARVTYQLFDLIKPGSIRLWGNEDYLELPLFESGDSKAYYGFTYEGAEVQIENAMRGKLKEVFLRAAYYDLETMNKGIDYLSWFGDDDYSFEYRFEDAEGNKLTYLGVVDDEVLIYDGAPHNFTAYLYVKVVDEISPRNLLTYLGTYNKDGCSFMMDELCIVIKHSRDLEPAVLKTEVSKPTDSSGQYLTGDEITFTVITNLESSMGVAIYCDGGELVRCNFSAAKKYDAEKKEITYELSAIMNKAGTHEIVAYALDKNNNPIKTKHSSATVTITVQDRNLCMPPKITTAKDQTIQVGTNLKLVWTASPYPTEGITYSVVVDYRGSNSWEYPLSGVSVDGTSYTIDGSVFSKPGRYGITVYPVSSNPDIKVPENCYSVIGINVSDSVIIPPDEPDFVDEPVFVFKAKYIADKALYGFGPNHIYSATVLSEDVSYVTITSNDGGDPHFYLCSPADDIIDVGARYVVVKYRTVVEGAGGEFFAGSGTGPTGGTDEVRFTYIADGEWHLAIADLSTVSAVNNNYDLNYLRYDPYLDGQYQSIDVAYIAAFESIEAAEKYFELSMDSEQPDEPTYGDDWAERIAIQSFDELNLYANGIYMDRAFVPVFSADWDRILYVDDSSIDSLKACGWCGFTDSSCVFGYSINGTKPIYLSEFTYAPDANMLFMASEVGADYAQTMRITIPIGSLMGEYDITLYVKYPDGAEEIFDEFTLVKTVTTPEIEDGQPLFVINAEQMYSQAASSGHTIANMVDGAEVRANGMYLTISGSGGDTYFAAIPLGSYVKAGRYIVIKYRIEADAYGEVFAGSGTGWTGNGDRALIEYVADGEWHLAILDLETLNSVEMVGDSYLLTYLRMDCFSHAYRTVMDIGYIASFDSMADARKYDEMLDYDRLPIDNDAPTEITHMGLYFTLNSDGESYSASGIGTCTQSTIVIPSTYMGKPVTGVSARAFWMLDSIIHVTFPESITHIDMDAFAYCNNLTGITISSNMVSIGNWVFWGSDNLTDIYYTGTEDEWDDISKGSGWITSDYVVHYNSKITDPDEPNFPNEPDSPEYFDRYVVDMNVEENRAVYMEKFAAAGIYYPVCLLGYDNTVYLGDLDLGDYTTVLIYYSCDGTQVTADAFATSSSLDIGLKKENSSFGQDTTTNYDGAIAYTDMVFSVYGWNGDGVRVAEIDLSGVSYSGDVWAAVHNPVGTQICIHSVQFLY